MQDAKAKRSKRRSTSLPGHQKDPKEKGKEKEESLEVKRQRRRSLSNRLSDTFFRGRLASRGQDDLNTDKPTYLYTWFVNLFELMMILTVIVFYFAH